MNWATRPLLPTSAILWQYRLTHYGRRVATQQHRHGVTLRARIRHTAGDEGQQRHRWRRRAARDGQAAPTHRPRRKSVRRPPNTSTDCTAQAEEAPSNSPPPCAPTHTRSKTVFDLRRGMRLLLLTSAILLVRSYRLTHYGTAGRRVARSTAANTGTASLYGPASATPLATRGSSDTAGAVAPRDTATAGAHAPPVTATDTLHVSGLTFRRMTAASGAQLAAEATERGAAAENVAYLSEIDDAIAMAAASAEAAGTAGSRGLLLWLPGLDGVGVSASAQWRQLVLSGFDVWRLRLGVEDEKMPFPALADAAAAFVEERVAEAPTRKLKKALVVGESFGGLLALGVARRLPPKHLQGVVLANPASSYDRTPWATLGPAVAQLPRELYGAVGGLLLFATVPSVAQYRRVVQTGGSFEKPLWQEPGQLTSRVSQLASAVDTLEKSLPAASIKRRLDNWLAAGCADVNAPEAIAAAADVPALVVCGAQDRLLPSADEAKRLKGVLKRSDVLTLRDAGHAALDDTFNLTAAVLSSRALGMYDPVKDFARPTPEAVAASRGSVDAARALLSPVWVSTKPGGDLVRGLGAVPTSAAERGGRPILLVGNHQLLGLDLGLLILEFLEQKDTVVRGLAHPAVFGAGFDGGGGGPGAAVAGGRSGGANLFETFGAVPVTPTNYYKLMDSGAAALLFPGGVREVYHKKGEAYKLFWPEETDFVRVAAKFDAIVVPFGAIGSSDSFNMVLDSDEVLELPFLGERLRKTAAAIPNPRGAGGLAETFVSPLVAPKASGPDRFYMVFGEPLDLTGVSHKDKDACAAAYSDVKASAEAAIQTGMELRKGDKFRKAAPRLAVEALTGRPAPSFRLPARM